MENRQATSHRSVRLPNLAHTPSNQPLHSYGFENAHRVGATIGLIVTAVLAFVLTFAAASYTHFSHVVASRGVQIITQPHSQKSQDILDPNSGRAINIVLMGQDSRDGKANSALGNDVGVGDHNADTTMILQISADRSYANLVSIPRDSIVSVPACTTSKGVIPARQNVMFNSIFATGYARDGISGAATCMLTAVRHLTKIPVTQFVIVDFAGMMQMIDSIGGVDVCVPVSFSDPYTGLSLKKGYQHLNGRNGTQFARLRHGLGDGSDIMRTARQQYLIKQLLRQVMAKNILTNANQLYQFAESALDSLQMSEGLANISTLTGLAYSLRHFNVSNLNSRTIPTQSYPADPNRVEFAPGAREVWEKFIRQEPLNAPSPSSSHAKGTENGEKKSNSSDSSQSSSQSTSTSKSENKESTPDPVTGLITRSDGTLMDPKTHGTVDKKTGIITDPNTGFPLGLADDYLNHAVCAVPAKK
jgi:LCP family protein required for cell wall assembly